jgi:hypothetical protein
MNRFARLLLEIKTDFLRFCVLLMDFLRVFLKHSGTVARMEGVVIGSWPMDSVFLLKTCKVNHTCVLVFP